MKDGRVVKGVNFVNLRDAGDLPVIASCGAGSLEHFYQGVTEGGADILLAASVFHFRKLSIDQVKKSLKGRGIPVLGV